MCKSVVQKVLATIRELNSSQSCSTLQVSENTGPLMKVTRWRIASTKRYCEQTHMICRLTKELVGRVHSLRYFTIMWDLQKQQSKPPTISCPKCRQDRVSLKEITVLSSCGHAGCFNNVKSVAESKTCVYACSRSLGMTTLPCTSPFFCTLSHSVPFFVLKNEINTSHWFLT
jgi:hypothetical protein